MAKGEAWEHISKRQKIESLAVIVIATILSLGLVASAHHEKTTSKRGGTTVLTACEPSEFRCYAEHYALLTHNSAPAAAFADIKQAYQQDDYVKSQCHQLVHIIGRTAYQKYGTLESAYPKGDNFCWSGYHHGIIEQAIAAIGRDKIKQQANEVCAAMAASNRYSFDHFNCVHGLGHGFMAIEDYELFATLKACDLLKDDWERRSCYGGVYMENVMVAYRGNGTSKYLKPDDLLYPCNAVETSYKQQCYLMQTSYALQKNGYNFSDTFRLCATADEGFQDTCYESIGRDASGSTASDVARTKAQCDVGHDANAVIHCMIGASKDFVSYYHSDKQALELCQAFGGDILEPCKETVSTYYATF